MAGAYIDMKNCEFFLEDGYSKTGAVNKTGGYTAGATAIVVDGFTGKLDSGVPVYFTGNDTQFIIASTVETGSDTTTINITPALDATLADNVVVTVGPHFVEVVMGEGNLTFSEKKAREYKLNRGLLDQVRNGDEAPIDVSMGFAWTYLSSGTGADVPTVEEFLERTGPAAAYVSTGGNPCEPYAVNIVLINKVPTCGSEAEPWERITLPEFRHEDLAHDPKAGTVTITGKCNVTKAIRERLAAS